MKNKLEKEIKNIIQKLCLNHFTKKLLNCLDEDTWNWICYNQTFSEDFIREFEHKVNWSYISEYQKLSENFIIDFQDEVDWARISYHQRLSEDFIREFQDEVTWHNIGIRQKLSEDFIREFKDKFDWSYISKTQKLSEDFIREFRDKVDWHYISKHQKLSEDFIREFQDRVDWNEINVHQILSKKFLKEFSDRLDIELYNQIHQKKTREQKIKEMKEYAQKWNLKFDGKYLYAFRKHSIHGRGSFNGGFYEKGKYYRDWKCDMREDVYNSFGFGIRLEGNTLVKVSVKDCWGVAIKDDSDGKARVWGFTVL